MANNETDKANKVARDAKAKVVELDARVYQIEGELKDALDRASGFESELRTYRAKYSEVKSTLSEKDSIIGGKEGKISSLSDKVCMHGFSMELCLIEFKTCGDIFEGCVISHSENGCRKPVLIEDIVVVYNSHSLIVSPFISSG